MPCLSVTSPEEIMVAIMRATAEPARRGVWQIGGLGGRVPWLSTIAGVSCGHKLGSDNPPTCEFHITSIAVVRAPRSRHMTLSEVMGMKLDVLLCDQAIDELEPRSTQVSCRRVGDGDETARGTWGRALPAPIP